MTREEKNRLNAINHVYKNSYAQRGREALHGTFKSGDMWAVCDSYRFIRTKNRPQELPESRGINIEMCIPNDAKHGEKCIMPTAQEIKEYTKAHGFTRVRNPGMIEAFPGWWCNPFYLLDMVQAFPDAVYYKPSNATTALYCESEDGDALLCPVRHSA